MQPRDLFFAEVCDGKLDREPFTIPTPAGPLTVYVEEVDQARIEEWRQEIIKHGGDPDAGEYDIAGQARLIVRCVVDADGKLFFTPDDVKRLTHGRTRYTDALYELCCRVNRIGSFSLLKKSSAPTRDSASSSSSASPPAASTSAPPPAS